MAERSTPAEGRKRKVKVEAEPNVAVNLSFCEGRVAGVGRLLILSPKKKRTRFAAARSYVSYQLKNETIQRGVGPLFHCP